MIDALKRKLGILPPTEVVETQEKDVTMDLNQTNSADAEVVASLQATVTELSTKLTESEAKVTELNALVAEAIEFQAAKDAASLKAKLDARLKTIEATVGTEKAAELMAATTSLNDTSFDAVIAAMKTAGAAEAKTVLFVEQGVDAEANVDTLVEANGVEGILRAKYQNSNPK